MPVTIDTPQLALRSFDSAWDRARWERLPADGNRYEVIDGVLYMTTAPSVFHHWIIRQLVRLLQAQIDDLGLGLTHWAPIGVFMPGCDPVQPDVFVVRAGDRHLYREGRIVGVPALIVEVLSPSHPALDTRIKREAYARAGVPEYWMVRPATRDVVLCTEPDPASGDYLRTQRIESSGELASPTLQVRFTVADLFAGAPDTTL
jgi:Uma2 family endonuclease